MTHGFEYSRYIQSSEWFNRKEEFFAIHGRKCKACGSNKSIHCHHMSYKNMGHEPDSDLVALCGSCHNGVHKVYNREKGNKNLKQVTLECIEKFRYGPHAKRKAIAKKKNRKTKHQKYKNTQFGGRSTVSLKSGSQKEIQMLEYKRKLELEKQ